MKIQEMSRINMGDLRFNSSDRFSTNAASFQKIMHTYTKELTQDHLQQLLGEIDQQGHILSEKPTFQELRKYKELVKRFMDEVTKNGMGLYQTETWDFYGGNKTLKTIQVLDRKLLELTNHVLNQQKDGLTILEKIGEIKGLLINLYT
ncbi:YaaR family protein [Bacillus thermocopriae]|uniref:YaaR family protein n=1 Tax=Neobacillus thermocopriae TaxID=1215031 RepID=A0A6B3TP70_9BACI|nr:YaaR family protein [Neobacillus thermocopriae]NEX78070.1 YaaR family protein [Neobacillus thermocopriae]